jgi:hypothetical protein
MTAARRGWAAPALVALGIMWPGVQAADAATPRPGQPAEAAATVTAWVGYPYAGFVASPWGCYPAWGGCTRPANWRLLLERQRRFDHLRQDSAAVAAPAMTNPWYGWSGAPLPPPTPEKQIQPAFRDRSVLRPEFRDGSQAPR